jgi:3-phosphoshikimate 1-carboxyvinyltransferase
VLTEEHRAAGRQIVRPASRLEGSVHLPPDKSIAHRAALLAALGEGISRIRNYPASADPQSTLSCIRALGIVVEERDGELFVHGRGRRGFHAPSGPLDCGNSGTTMRLLAGILAGQEFESILVGDASLSRRPMARIAQPLALMGAEIAMTDGHAPITIRGNVQLRAIDYVLPVPSAQVKSCVLLAGLYADGETTVVEKEASRDHTERMLGLVSRNHEGQRYVTSSPEVAVASRDYVVPADFSAAAFFLVAGSIVPDSELFLPAVGMNPSRTGLIDVLRDMGADIQIENKSEEGGEPVADLLVRSATLRGIEVQGPVIANIIDEIPVLAVAAAVAEGRTVIRGAAELRVKETDRLAALALNLRKLGVDVEEFADGIAIVGGKGLEGAAVQSFEDHRIAMSMAVAGLVADGQTEIDHPGCVAISFPSFWETLGSVER